MKLPFKALDLKRETQTTRRKSFVAESKSNQYISMKRSWRKLPFWGKVGWGAGLVGSKVAILGLGYYGGKKAAKKQQPKKYMAG